MLIVTWNVNSLKARLPRVTEWLDEVRPDVVCMQETKMTDAAFPALTFKEMGYDSAHFGQGQWNGVAILSRVGLDKPRANFATGEPDAEARIITAECGALDHDHYKYKLRWMAQLREHAAAVSKPGGNLVIAGDYNIAPDDRDVWDPAKLEGQTHVSKAERDTLVALEAWGLRDVFRDHYQDGKLYSWWDYRGGDFHQGRGMRIDLMYATKPVAERTTWCGIDRNARKGEQPSDHAPVMMLLGS